MNPYHPPASPSRCDRRVVETVAYLTYHILVLLVAKGLSQKKPRPSSSAAILAIKTSRGRQTPPGSG